MTKASQEFETANEPCSDFESSPFYNETPPTRATRGTNSLENQKDRDQLKVSAQAVYDEDNRQDKFESSEELKSQWARSTLALIGDSKIQITKGGLLKINAKTHKEKNNLCPGIPFSDQPTAASCSGFLIHNDLIITAGHCVRDLSHCKEIHFVFDFAKFEEDQKEYLIHPSSAYSCKEILVKNSGRDDFIVIRLDRPVTDRPPLPFRRQKGGPKYGEKIILIGHPGGLPVKITEGSVIGLKVSGFLVSTDASSGSSGSVAINPESGVVEGLLVSGVEDYIDNGSCQTEYLCGANGDSCIGELITPISKVINSIPKCSGTQ